MINFFISELKCTISKILPSGKHMAMANQFKFLKDKK
jgi:hypothetical protein